jgi:O-antigen ligase
MLTLPLGGSVVVFCIIGLIIDFLVFKKWKNLVGFNQLKNVLFLLTIFYGFIFISMFWTQNVREGWFELEQKLSLLILPLLVFANKKMLQQNIKLLLNAFIYSNFGVAFFIIAKSVIAAQSLVLSTNLFSLIPFYSSFSVFIHVAYFSFYIVLSLVIILFLLYHESKIAMKCIYFLTYILLHIPLYYLSSKAAFLAYFIMILILVGMAIMYSKHKIVYLILTLIMLAILGYFAKQNPRIYSLKKMAIELIHPESATPEISSDVSNGQRIFVIKSSIEVAVSNFMIGVGAGDVIDELQKNYQNNKYKILAEKKLNCHNQYLESFIELGFLGGILFLLISILSIINAIKNRNFYLFVFVIGFFIMANTESFLNHQAGVVFFALFLSLFSILNNDSLNCT